MSQEILRHLPPVGQLLEHPRLASMIAGPSRGWITRLVQREVDRERLRLLENGATPQGERNVLKEALVDRIVRRIDELTRSEMRRVINATGIVVHTNLGRSLYPQRAVDWMSRAALYDCDLEMDLATGCRGHRGRLVEEKLALLTGAADALIVNNNAAALWLSVRSVAAGGRVLLSRGEVVAIGGSFRLHDIINETGCELVEIGTTNRTSLADYAAALTPDAVVLKVHRSNFKLSGFTEDVVLSELAALCREKGNVLIRDAGSGLLDSIAHCGLAHEPTVAQDLDAGVDLVTCSGDKLFGGGQAGMIVGRSDLVEAMRSHPMRRTFRVDKTTLAAVDGVLSHYLAGDHRTEIPTLVFLERSEDELQARCESLGAALASDLPAAWSWRVQPGVSQVGGGAGADSIQPTRLLMWTAPREDLELCHKLLRTADPAVAARISQSGLAFDLRAVRDGEISLLETAMRDSWKLLAEHESTPGTGADS